MKKSSIFVMTAVMILAAVVIIVGATAAWFSNVTRVERDNIIVSSNQPVGNATIIAGSGSSGTTEQPLAPARLRAGLALADVGGTYGGHTISNLPVYGAEAESLVSADDDTKPLLSTAVSTDMQFGFKYTGAATENDGMTRRVSVLLTSVTLSNPRSKDEDDNVIIDTSLVNYCGEFGTIMSISTEDEFVTENQTYAHFPLTLQPLTDENPHGYYQDGQRLFFYVVTGVEYTFNVTVYFTHVDELTPPELMDTELFFNFELKMN